MHPDLGPGRFLANRFVDFFLAWHHEPTAKHCRRVAQIAVRTALELRPWLQDDLQTIALGALLHDMGKVAVPVSILDKPGPLDREEEAILKAHPIHSAHLLSALPDLDAAVSIVRHHHERWDGQGYPTNQRGEQIPLGARIVAVADAYDAMRCNRPYKQGKSHWYALQDLELNAGRQFDPAIVKAFTQIPEYELANAEDRAVWATATAPMD